MRTKVISIALGPLALALGSGVALSQNQVCDANASLMACVAHIADIAQGFDDKLAAVYAEITRRELPVGTIITSTLPPDVFLSDSNPQIDPNRWVPADGRALPANTTYQKMTNVAYAPDLRTISTQEIVLDVIAGEARSGQIVDQLKTPEFANADWTMHFSLRNLSGNRYNNDYEQDEDHFQIFTKGGKVVAQGRTYNWKHGKWGDWKSDGDVNYLGIASVKSPFHYYIKIN